MNRESGTRWETYDEEKAQNFLTWLIDAGVDFSLDRLSGDDQRNHMTVKWVFHFPGKALVEFVADQTRA